MDWLNIISNNENIVSNISIVDDFLYVKVKLWNGKEKVLQFTNYIAFKEKRSIGEEIGDIIIQKQSQLLEELKSDIVEGDGSLEELKNIISIVFMNAWNDRIIFEVLAESVEWGQYDFSNSL